MASMFTAIYAYGTHTVWNSSAEKIKLGQVIITSDGYIKIGTGNLAYKDLPTLLDPTLSEISDPVGNTITNIKNDIVTLFGLTDAHGNAISAIISVNDTQNSRITSLEGYRIELDALIAMDIEQNDRLDALVVRANNADDDRDNLKDQILALTAGIDLSSVQEQIDDLSTRIVDLSSSMTDSLTEITDDATLTKTALADHVTETGNVHELTLADLNAASADDLTALSSAVDQAASDVSATLVTVSGINQKISGLEDDITAIESVNTTQDGKLLVVEEQVRNHSHSIGTLTASSTNGLVPFTTGTREGSETTPSILLERIIQTAYVTENAEELAIARAYKIPGSELFKSWSRFSHNGATQPAVPAELDSWTYNEATDKLNNLTNSVSYVGFVSKQTYSNYVLETHLSSTAGDDDIITVIGAFATDADGFEHSLSFIRTPGGATGKNKVWSCTYNLQINSTENPTFVQEELVGDNEFITYGNNKTLANGGATAGWNTLTNGTKVKIIRNGNIITAMTTNWDDPDTYVTDATLTIDLTSDPRLSVFLGSSSIGIGVQSQASSTIEILNFTNPSTYIYDLTNNGRCLYFDVDTNTWLVQQNGTILTNIGIGRMVRNPITKKLFYITPSETICVATVNVGGGSTTTEQLGKCTLPLMDTEITVSFDTPFSNCLGVWISPIGMPHSAMSGGLSVLSYSNTGFTIKSNSGYSEPLDICWQAKGR